MDFFSKLRYFSLVYVGPSTIETCSGNHRPFYEKFQDAFQIFHRCPFTEIQVVQIRIHNLCIVVLFLIPESLQSFSFRKPNRTLSHFWAQYYCIAHASQEGRVHPKTRSLRLRLRPDEKKLILAFSLLQPSPADPTFFLLLASPAHGSIFLPRRRREIFLLPHCQSRRHRLTLTPNHHPGFPIDIK